MSDQNRKLFFGKRVQCAFQRNEASSLRFRAGKMISRCFESKTQKSFMNFIGKNGKKVSFGVAHAFFDSNLRESSAKSIKIGSKIQAKRFIFPLARGWLASG